MAAILNFVLKIRPDVITGMLVIHYQNRKTINQPKQYQLSCRTSTHIQSVAAGKLYLSNFLDHGLHNITISQDLNRTVISDSAFATQIRVISESPTHRYHNRTARTPGRHGSYHEELCGPRGHLGERGRLPGQDEQALHGVCSLGFLSGSSHQAVRGRTHQLLVPRSFHRGTVRLHRNGTS